MFTLLSPIFIIRSFIRLPTHEIRYGRVSSKQNRILESVLTAVFGGKLPQVKILHGEVNKGGQFAGSSCLREAFQVWTGGESRNNRSVLYNSVQGFLLGVSLPLTEYQNCLSMN